MTHKKRAAVVTLIATLFWSQFVTCVTPYTLAALQPVNNPLTATPTIFPLSPLEEIPETITAPTFLVKVTKEKISENSASRSPSASTTMVSLIPLVVSGTAGWTVIPGTPRDFQGSIKGHGTYNFNIAEVRASDGRTAWLFSMSTPTRSDWRRFVIDKGDLSDLADLPSNFVPLSWWNPSDWFKGILDSIKGVLEDVRDEVRRTSDKLIAIIDVLINAIKEVTAILTDESKDKGGTQKAAKSMKAMYVRLAQSNKTGTDRLAEAFQVYLNADTDRSFAASALASAILRYSERH